MTDYSPQMDRIKAARSLDEIRAIANAFPAKAQGEGAIFYSGWIGNVRSEVVAKELSRKTGVPIINDTARAEFLSTKSVERGIQESAKRIFMARGENLELAKHSSENLLYGEGKAPPGSPISVQHSLWGQASREFVVSAHGPVTVVATTANAERVLAQVEVTTALQSTRITTLAGHPLSHVQAIHAKGGIAASLHEVQAQFVNASTRGIFVLPDNFGVTPSQISVSREFASALNLDASKFVGEQALAEAGFVRASLSPTVGVAPLPASADIAIHGEFFSKVARGLGAVGAVAMAYDAHSTAEQYEALSAQGNAFGADALLHRYEGRTAGGFLGGFGAGAAYGLAAGSETGRRCRWRGRRVCRREDRHDGERAPGQSSDWHGRSDLRL